MINPSIFNANQVAFTLLLLQSLLLTPLAKATESAPWYQVDILIFARPYNSIHSTEKWQKTSTHNRPMNSVQLHQIESLEIEKSHIPTSFINLSDSDEDNTIAEATYSTATSSATADYTPDTDITPLILLPENTRLLNKEANTIKKSRALRLLKHLSFYTPLKKDTESPPIYIQGGQLVGKIWEVEGNIQLSSKRFTHVAIDLWLSELNPLLPIDHILLKSDLLIESNNDDKYLPIKRLRNITIIPNINKPIANFHFQESRRLHVDEINYFDSPTLGIIIYISDYKSPE